MNSISPLSLMSFNFRLLCCCVSALLAASCQSSHGPLMFGPWLGQPALPRMWGEGERAEYVPAAPSFCRELHEACRRCAAVEFSLSHTDARHRVERQHLEEALSAILSVDEWYSRRLPEGYVLKPGREPHLRFLDEQGQELFSMTCGAAGEGFACAGGQQYASAWEMMDSWVDREALAGRPLPLVLRTGRETTEKPRLAGYRVLAEDEAAALRHALRHARTAELLQPVEGQPRVVRVVDGEPLAASLSALAQVPLWYEGVERTAYPSSCEAAETVRFLDEQGRLLYEVSGRLVALEVFGGTRSLTSYLPFPRPWDDLNKTIVGPFD